MSFKTRRIGLEPVLHPLCIMRDEEGCLHLDACFTQQLINTLVDYIENGDKCEAFTPINVRYKDD